MIKINQEKPESWQLQWLHVSTRHKPFPHISCWLILWLKSIPPAVDWGIDCIRIPLPLHRLGWLDLDSYWTLIKQRLLFCTKDAEKHLDDLFCYLSCLLAKLPMQNVEQFREDTISAHYRYFLKAMWPQLRLHWIHRTKYCSFKVDCSFNLGLQTLWTGSIALKNC